MHTDLLSKIYGVSADFHVRAPGRINLIGEHTDYNFGYVFPAAIDRYMYIDFRANGSGIHRIYAADKNKTIEINKNKIVKSQAVWANYLIGVLEQFNILGIDVPGFDCAFKSEIPIGAGVSSSAALECGFIMGIDRLCSSQLSPWDMAKMGNRVENKFLGIQSGILDQFASIFGRQNQAMLLDCRNLSYDYFNIEFAHYHLVLINTGIKHSHLISGYNDRSMECKMAVKEIAKWYPTIKSLRDVSLDMINTTEVELPPRLYNRALFILEENRRVHKFKEALNKNDYATIGQLLYQSHHGLQHLYEVSCYELDLLVDVTRDMDQVLGARMMGGGFGGCTLNLIQVEERDQTIDQITNAYRDQTNIKPEVYIIEISDGVEIF